MRSILLLTFCGASFGQSVVDIMGSHNSATATALKTAPSQCASATPVATGITTSGAANCTASPVASGLTAALPGTCSTGQEYFATDATAGQNIYTCAPTNTWTQNGTGGGGGGANTALSNLASVSVNTSLIAQTGVDLGAASTPFRNLYIFGAGTYGTGSLKLTGTPTAARVWTIQDATDTFVGLATTDTLTNKTLTSPSITAIATESNNAIAATVTDGIVIQNTTAAVSGTQQYSPSLRLHGLAYSTGSSASQAVDWRCYVIPQQASTITSQMFCAPGLNGSYSTSAGLLLNSTPSTTTPVLSFRGTSDPNTGIGQGASGSMDFISNTVDQMHMQSANWVWQTAEIVGWAATTLTNTSTPDTALARNAAGVAEINNGTACSSSTSNCRDLKSRHTLAAGALPTLSTGTGSLDATAADESGRVTLSAGAQSTVVITFGTAYTNKPACSAEDETAAVSSAFVQSVPTTTTLTINALTTFGSADAISWICKGH